MSEIDILFLLNSYIREDFYTNSGTKYYVRDSENFD